MKKLINDAGGYKTYIELTPIEVKSFQGWTNMRVTTVWENARSIVEEQVKFQMNLDPEALKNLKEMLNDY